MLVLAWVELNFLTVAGMLLWIMLYVCAEHGVDNIEVFLLLSKTDTEAEPSLLFRYTARAAGSTWEAGEETEPGQVT